MNENRDGSVCCSSSSVFDLTVKNSFLRSWTFLSSPSLPPSLSFHTSSLVRDYTTVRDPVLHFSAGSLGEDMSRTNMEVLCASVALSSSFEVLFL